MLNKFIVYFSLLTASCGIIPVTYAQENGGLGQLIQIYTRFHSFVGRPSWLLTIRGVDTGESISYLFDIKRGNNFWVAFTYSRNYLITVSNLQFSPYTNSPYRSKRINNFCDLESHGRIIRGESMYITINGNLRPDTNAFTCHVSRYADANFTIVTPEVVTTEVATSTTEPLPPANPPLPVTPPPVTTTEVITPTTPPPISPPPANPPVTNAEVVVTSPPITPPPTNPPPVNTP